MTPTRPLIPVAAIALFAYVSPAAAQRIAVDGARLSIETQRFAPDAWQSDAWSMFGAAGVSFGGARLFADLDIAAEPHARVAPGANLLVRNGTDTTFTVPVPGSTSPTTPDSVTVAFPSFERWDGATWPFDRRGVARGGARLQYAVAPASDLSLGVRVDRVQRLSRPAADFYNAEREYGEQWQSNALTLAGRIELPGSVDGSLMLNAVGARRTAVEREGVGRPDANDDVFGFQIDAIDFLADEDLFDYDERADRALEYGSETPDAYRVLNGRLDRTSRFTVPWIPVPLRLNPFGVNNVFPVAGIGPDAGTGYAERRLEENAVDVAIEWMPEPAHFVVAGADWSSFAFEQAHAPLFTGLPDLDRAVPSRLGAFLKYAVRLQDIDVATGLRFDRITPGGSHPRVPGFVIAVPDSLRADWWVVAPAGPGDERTEAERIRQENLCAGLSACRPNFVEADVQSVFSPSLSVGAHHAAGGTIRASYVQHAYGPGARIPFEGEVDAGRWAEVMFQGARLDLTRSAAPGFFGRDVRFPVGRVVQLDVVQPFGSNVTAEAALSRRSVRDAWGARMVEFVSPLTGTPLSRPVLRNVIVEPINGAELRVTHATTTSEFSVSYSFRDLDEGPGRSVLAGLPAPRATPQLSLGEREPGFGPGSPSALDVQRRHLVEATLMLRSDGADGLLRDAGVQMLVRSGSGVPYYRSINTGSGVIGPIPPEGVPDPLDPGLEIAGTGSTPWVSWGELRVHKGFRVGPTRARAFVQLSGVLAENRSHAFLETGGTANPAHRERVLLAQLSSERNDGDTNIDGFRVGDCLGARTECDVPESETVVNAYALQQAEIRFGDGDGYFDVAEQERAFGAFYDMLYGEQWLARDDRALRVGIELIF